MSRIAAVISSVPLATVATLPDTASAVTLTPPASLAVRSAVPRSSRLTLVSSPDAPATPSALPRNACTSSRSRRRASLNALPIRPTSSRVSTGTSRVRSPCARAPSADTIRRIDAMTDR